MPGVDEGDSPVVRGELREGLLATDGIGAMEEGVGHGVELGTGGVEML